jgi:TatD DNase family protein
MITKKDSPLHHQFLRELKAAGEAGAFFTDSHAHIHMQPLAEDMEGVLKRADENFVRRIVTIGCGLEDSLLAQKAAESHENVFFAAGIHPHDSSEAGDVSDVTKGFGSLFAHPKCIAIGEIGLDYFYDLSPRDVQQKVFRHFLQLAKEYKKPVVIHNRDSAEDCVRILNDELKGRDRNGIIHCFSGDIELMRWALDNGFYISYAGPVTYSKSDDLRATLEYVPVDRLLVETDSPYLSPMPYRGKTNEPANTVYNAHEISTIKGMNLYEFAVQLEKNYINLIQA